MSDEKAAPEDLRMQHDVVQRPDSYLDVRLASVSARVLARLPQFECPGFCTDVEHRIQFCLRVLPPPRIAQDSGRGRALLCQPFPRIGQPRGWASTRM